MKKFTLKGLSPVGKKYVYIYFLLVKRGMCNLF